MIFTRFLQLVVLLLTVLFLGACSTKTSDRHLVFLDVSQAIDAVREQRRPLGGTTTGIWVDARTELDYNVGHIPGAIHLPLERVREEHQPLREYTTIVVYGSAYNSPRASAVSKLLMELGHKDVRILRGGFKSWKDAGHRVATP